MLGSVFQCPFEAGLSGTVPYAPFGFKGESLTEAGFVLFCLARHCFRVTRVIMYVSPLRYACTRLRQPNCSPVRTQSGAQILPSLCIGAT